MISPIGKFKTGSYSVSRHASGSYVDGRYVAGVLETLTVEGSMQPLSGRNIEMVEEGERITDYFTFWSDKRLSLASTVTLGRSDVITINNETYKCVGTRIFLNKTNYSGIKLPHYETTLKREPQQ